MSLRKLWKEDTISHQNVTNVTKQNIASKEILTLNRISYEVYEIVCKYVVHHLCIAQYKIP